MLDVCNSLNVFARFSLIITCAFETMDKRKLFKPIKYNGTVDSRYLPSLHTAVDIDEPKVILGPIQSSPLGE